MATEISSVQIGELAVQSQFLYDRLPPTMELAWLLPSDAAVPNPRHPEEPPVDSDCLMVLYGLPVVLADTDRPALIVRHRRTSGPSFGGS